MRIYLKHKAPFDQSPRAQLDHHSSDLDSEMQVCFPPRLREERRERGRKGGKEERKRWGSGWEERGGEEKGEAQRREEEQMGKSMLLCPEDTFIVSGELPQKADCCPIKVITCYILWK